jgi:hypothetical protein
MRKMRADEVVDGLSAPRRSSADDHAEGPPGPGCQFVAVRAFLSGNSLIGRSEARGTPLA